MKLVNYKDVIDIVFDNYNEDLEDILDLLYALPKTEVVRCKDCRWYDNIGCALIIVDEEDRPKPDDYCSYGERKKE